MYIKKISLDGIKGFKGLEFDLTRSDGTYAGWTVFTGDNGSGKSTLLKAIAIALTGPEVARSLQPSLERWISDGVINAPEAVIELSIVPREGVDAFTGSGNRSSRPISSKVVLERGARGTSIRSPVSNAKTQAQRGPWASTTAGWFSCGYGPFRRVFGASSDAARLMVAPVTERYVTMFQEAASLSEVDLWMRSLKHKEFEGRQLETQQLELITALLSDELMPEGIAIERIDSDGLWLKDGNGVLLSWGEMSDGYRAILGLLTDIVRHLLKTYGLPKSGDVSEVLNSTGVVMIDEVDAHLHPAWQREIGFWLKKRFPNIQFLVTTHSPLICQAADSNGLFTLPQPGSSDRPRALTSEEYQTVIASKADTILLSPAFGLENTRSEVAVKKRQRYSALVAKQQAGIELTSDEAGEKGQLEMFVDKDES